MDLLDKAAEEDILAGVSGDAWKKFSANMYEATTREMGKLKIERHQRSIVIFVVEETGYTTGDTNERILKMILQKAGMEERIPLLAIRSIQFRGRKTSTKPTLDSSKPKPTMFIKFTNDEYVFRMLELPGKLKEVPDYNKLSFRRSVPSGYI